MKQLLGSDPDGNGAGVSQRLSFKLLRVARHAFAKAAFPPDDLIAQPQEPVQHETENGAMVVSEDNQPNTTLDTLATENKTDQVVAGDVPAAEQGIPPTPDSKDKEEEARAHAESLNKLLRVARHAYGKAGASFPPNDLTAQPQEPVQHETESGAMVVSEDNQHNRTITTLATENKTNEVVAGRFPVTEQGIPYTQINDPKHWWAKAEEARAQAESLNSVFKKTMLTCAAHYELLAKRAERLRNL